MRSPISGKWLSTKWFKKKVAHSGFTQFQIVFCSRIYACIRLCFISEERLERRRALQREFASNRRARKSAEEREECLSRRRAVQRIGNESTVDMDREARLLQMHTIHQWVTSSKMQQLLARLASLQSPKCVTCQPSRQVSATNDEMECVRCSRDKHIPKMYRAGNLGQEGNFGRSLVLCYSASQWQSWLLFLI